MIINIRGIVFFLAFIVSFVLSGLNYENPDYFAYFLSFEEASSKNPSADFEIGYTYLEVLISTLSLDYFFYVLFLFFFAYLLYFNVLYRIKLIFLFTFAYYFSYTFFFDYIQIRNFIASIFIVYAIAGAIFNNISILKFTLAIIIASLFHVSSLFYLLFILLFIESKKIFLILLSIFFVAIFVLLNSASYIIELVPKYSHYAFDKTSYKTRLFFSIYFIAIFGYNYLFYRLIKNRNLKIERFLLLVFLVLPFLFVGLDFIRFYRNIFVIYGMVAGYLFVRLHSIPKLIFAFISIVHVIFAHIFFVKVLVFTNVISPMFDNNYLIDWFAGVFS